MTSTAALDRARPLRRLRAPDRDGRRRDVTDQCFHGDVTGVLGVSGGVTLTSWVIIAGAHPINIDV